MRRLPLPLTLALLCLAVLPGAAIAAPDADLAVAATGPPGVHAGAPVNYAVTVTNSGPDSATNNTLTVTLPSALRFASITAPAGWNCTTPAVGANGTVTCTNPSFANGASSQFSLGTTLNPAHSGQVSTSFSVAGTHSDPDPADNTATVHTQVSPSADVGITMTADRDAVTPGETVTFTATVANAGPHTATDVYLQRFNHYMGEGLDIVSVTSSQGSCQGGDSFSCTIGSIANGVSVTVTVVAGIAPGYHDNPDARSAQDLAVQILSDVDPASKNNSTSAGVLVRKRADLQLTASGPATIVAGEALRYLVTVANDGLGTAYDVEIAFTLPDGAAFVSLEQTAGPAATCPATVAGTLTCSVQALGVGAKQTFALTVRPAAVGAIKASFSVASSTMDIDSSDQAADVTTAVTAPPAPAPTPAPTPTPTVTPQPKPPGDRCTSRRRFALRLMRRDLPGLRVNLKGARVRSAVVRTLGGRTVRRLRFTARRVRVDLRNLKPARYTVRLRVRLRTGRTITAVARYRTCRAPS